MPPTHALDSSLGAVVIGCMVSLFLLGVLTVQVFSYFRNFADDSRKLKLMITVIWVTEVIHGALIGASTYEKTVTYFGDVQELFHLRATFNLSLAFVGAIGPMVQSFYAYRILKISGRRFIPILIWTLLLLRFINVLAISVTSFMVPDIIAYKARFGWLLICSLSSAAAEDVLITATTCYYLRAERKSSVHFRRTRRMVDLLILWTAQTALVTSSGTVSMLLCFLLMDNFVWVGILFVFPLFFSNSLLATLNSRTILHDAGKTTTDLAGVPSGLSFLVSHPPNPFLPLPSFTSLYITLHPRTTHTITLNARIPAGPQ
ncbi:hypothetical protein C8R46DRAFT_1081953 [Mycena filopes]|nr:hypothetical protein C8R46DRAFT_1081953 [Mycena filopes]